MAILLIGNLLINKGNLSGLVSSNISGKLIAGKITSKEIKEILGAKYPNLAGQYKLTVDEDYQLYLPINYKAQNKYPLFLNYSIGANQWAKYADKYQFIAASADVSVFAMAALREKIIEQYSIDQGKVFLAGFSSGAFNSTYVFFSAPDKFGGAILASGGNSDNYQQGSDLKNKRFYITLGEKDFDGNIASAKNLKALLEKNGAIVKFELRPNQGHEYPAFQDEEMIKFVLNK